MRFIQAKYEGSCARCGAALSPGDRIAYERATGIFCVGCEPTDTEEIRSFRRSKADAKADRIAEWAAARERRARAFQGRCDSLMGRDRSPDGRADWALVTQPGHIPQRAQALRLQEKAWEEQRAAQHHRDRASSARHVVVKGDRERARQAKRESALRWVKKGMVVEDPFYGEVAVTRVNKKTVSFRRESDGAKGKSCLSWILPVAGREEVTP